MMNKNGENIQERSYAFALQVVILARKFPRTSEGFALGGQIIRAVTSIPANLFEGSAGVSRKDFVQFISIAKKSAVEMTFWIRIASDLGLFTKDQSTIMQKECDQIVRILSKIILNTKANSA